MYFQLYAVPSTYLLSWKSVLQKGETKKCATNQVTQPVLTLGALALVHFLFPLSLSMTLGTVSICIVSSGYDIQSRLWTAGVRNESVLVFFVFAFVNGELGSRLLRCRIHGYSWS